MDVLLPFSRHKPTGSIVGVDEVERGAACECVCIFCDMPMVAKKGDHKTHHFAHAQRVVNEDHACEASFERCVFWMCRRVLTEASTFRTPSYQRVYRSPAPEVIHITDASTVEFTAVEYPEPMSVSNTPDVAVLTIGAHRIAVVLHMDRDRLRFSDSPYRYQDLILPTIAVDLCGMQDVFRRRSSVFRDVVGERVLLDVEHKRWLYHPREQRLLQERAAITVRGDQTEVGKPRRSAKTGKIIGNK